MEGLLRLKIAATCIWRAAIPGPRPSGVWKASGQRSNCGRTNKEGIDFVKASTPGLTNATWPSITRRRNTAAAGCRFFLAQKAVSRNRRSTATGEPDPALRGLDDAL